jgi:hypothetical protein
VEEQFQVSEDQMLQRPQGQTCLRKFLDSKGLLYQPGDALDVGRFLKDVLPGATPLPDMPEVYTARAIHERCLGAPGLRLIPDGGIVRQTILKSVTGGQAIVRLPDERAYDAKGCVEGPAGHRRRVPGALTSFALDDSVYVTRAGSQFGILWVKEDTAKYGSDEGGPSLPPPPQAARVIATTWAQVLQYAEERPLVELHLVATTPAAAAALAGVVQPLGADTLTLSVNVGGNLKDGGSLNFAASDLKPTHPTKPLTIAQTLFNALVEGSAYEADLALGFGAAGRTGLETSLRTLADGVPEGVTPRATYEKPIKGGR